MTTQEKKRPVFIRTKEGLRKMKVVQDKEGRWSVSLFCCSCGALIAEKGDGKWSEGEARPAIESFLQRYNAETGMDLKPEDWFARGESGL